MTASIVSLTSSVVTLQAFSGNVNTRFDNLQTYTTSVDSRFTTLGSYTASVNQTTSSLNSFTESTNTRLGLLETSTGSLNTFSGSTLTRLTLLETSTGSLNTFSSSTLTRLGLMETSTGSLNLFTASAYVSFSLMTASIDDHEDRINYIYGVNGLGGGNPLTPLNEFSASINTFTSSLKGAITISGTDVSIAGGLTVLGTTTIIDSTVVNIKDNIIQLNGAGAANAGIVVRDATGTTTSGSLLWDTTNDRWIAGPLGSEAKVLTDGMGLISGSGQLGNYETTGRGIVSGSSQITFSGISSLPTLVSGSSQITLSSTTGGGTSANVQFGSLGIGTAASGVSGEIRATADITAFYSSDIRLKENIQPIQNALEKVESISGNTYDWKEGYEELHSHKGNDIGVIAQEIEAILPQIVTNRDNGYKAVQYEKIVPLLIEAIKELSEKIKRLENK